MEGPTQGTDGKPSSRCAPLWANYHLVFTNASLGFDVRYNDDVLKWGTMIPAVRLQTSTINPNVCCIKTIHLETSIRYQSLRDRDGYFYRWLNSSLFQHKYYENNRDIIELNGQTFKLPSWDGFVNQHIWGANCPCQTKLGMVWTLIQWSTETWSSKQPWSFQHDIWSCVEAQTDSCGSLIIYRLRIYVHMMIWFCPSWIQII